MGETTEGKKTYKWQTWLVSLGLIADVVFIAAWVFDDSLFFLLTLVAVIPFLGLLGCVGLTLTTTYRLHNKREETLFTAALVVLILPWAGATASGIVNGQARYFYELSQGDTLTVYRNYLIFEPYTGHFRPMRNYVKMPRRCDNYQLILDKNDHLYIWVGEKGDKVDFSHSKYPVAAIYEEWGGDKSMQLAVSMEERRAEYEFYYIRDGLFSGGHIIQKKLVGDSVTCTEWDYPLDKVNQRQEYPCSTISLDSACARYAKDTSFYHLWPRGKLLYDGTANR